MGKPHWFGVGFVLCAALASREAGAETFFRYSPGDGRIWNQHSETQRCFIMGENSVYFQNWPQYPECQTYPRSWMVSPPTRHSSSPHQVFPWVQGRIDDNQTICFQAWSYDQFGYSWAASAYICPATGNFDQNLTINGLQIPAYGTFTIVGTFAPSTEPAAGGWSRWAAVAYNYSP